LIIFLEVFKGLVEFGAKCEMCGNIGDGVTFGRKTDAP